MRLSALSAATAASATLKRHVKCSNARELLELFWRWFGTADKSMSGSFPPVQPGPSRTRVEGSHGSNRRSLVD
jgi:hypothetical protein